MRLFALSFLTLALAACGTTEDVADDTTDAAGDVVGATSDVVDDIPAATADAAGTVADVAGDGLDAAGDAVVMSAEAIAGVAQAAYDEARDVLGVGSVADDARVAVAQIRAPEDTTTSVRGTVTFVETDSGVRVRYDLAGLSEGRHGFHLHSSGSCAAGDFDDDGYAEAGGAAGLHLNPGNNEHGSLDDPVDERHAGDLGNVMPDASGEATGAKTTAALAFDGERSVLNRAAIVHADPDEFLDAGAMAGGRVGCGIVRLADRTGAQ